MDDVPPSSSNHQLEPTHQHEQDQQHQGRPRVVVSRVTTNNNHHHHHHRRHHSNSARDHITSSRLDSIRESDSEDTTGGVDDQAAAAAAAAAAASAAAAAAAAAAADISSSGGDSASAGVQQTDTAIGIPTAGGYEHGAATTVVAVPDDDDPVAVAAVAAVDDAVRDIESGRITGRVHRGTTRRTTNNKNKRCCAVCCRSTRRRVCVCWVSFISILVLALMCAIITLQVMYFTAEDALLPSSSTPVIFTTSVPSPSPSPSRWLPSTSPAPHTYHNGSPDVSVLTKRTTTTSAGESASSQDGRFDVTDGALSPTVISYAFSPTTLSPHLQPTRAPASTNTLTSTTKSTSTSSSSLSVSLGTGGSTSQESSVAISTSADISQLAKGDLRLIIIMLVLALFGLGTLMVIGAVLIAKGACKCLQSKSSGGDRSTRYEQRYLNNSSSSSASDSTSHHAPRSRHLRRNHRSMSAATDSTIVSNDSSVQLHQLQHTDNTARQHSDTAPPQHPAAANTHVDSGSNSSSLEDDAVSMSSRSSEASSGCTVMISRHPRPRWMVSDVGGGGMYGGEPPPQYHQTLVDGNREESSSDDTAMVTSLAQQQSAGLQHRGVGGLPSYEAVTNQQLPRYEDVVPAATGVTDSGGSDRVDNTAL